MGFATPGAPGAAGRASAVERTSDIGQEWVEGCTAHERAEWCPISGVLARDAACPRTSRAPEAAGPAWARCHAHAATPPANRNPRYFVGRRRSATPAPARSGASAPAPQNRRGRDRQAPVSARPRKFVEPMHCSARHPEGEHGPASCAAHGLCSPTRRSDRPGADARARRPAEPNRPPQAARRAPDVRLIPTRQHETTVGTV